MLATIPLAAFLGLLRIEQLYAVNFLVSILTIFFDVAYQSYLPSLIHRAELIEGNSKLSASASVAEVGGFAVAGWLVQVFTGPITILIDAISFVVSATSVGLIRVREPESAHSPQPNLRREIAEGLRSLLHNATLRVTVACTISQEFFVGVYSALVVLYMARDLGFAPGVLGTIWALGGISSLVGALATDPTSKRFGIGPAMIAACFLSGLAMIFVPLAQGATLTTALLLILQQLLGDGAATIYQINQVSLRQAITPERLLGRVNASAEFLGLGALLAGCGNKITLGQPTGNFSNAHSLSNLPENVRFRLIPGRQEPDQPVHQALSLPNWNAIRQSCTRRLFWQRSRSPIRSSSTSSIGQSARILEVLLINLLSHSVFSPMHR